MGKPVYVCCQRARQYDEYSRRQLQNGSMREFICVTDPKRLHGLHGIRAVLLLPMHDAHLAVDFKDALQSALADWTEEDYRGD